MINEHGVCEYFFNSNPLIAEEYLLKINELHLNLNNFCAYQGKLEELCYGDGNHLVRVIEELSSSVLLKPQHEEFRAKIQKCDEMVKNDSEALQALRMDKVKMKGLQEFVE